MERTIKVTGTGKINISPDQIIINILQSNTRKSYEETVSEMRRAKSELDRVIKDVGLNSKDIKTKSINIDTEYKYYENREKKLIGYKYNHSMSLKIDLDNDLLIRLINSISNMKYVPVYSMQYTIKNVDEAKNQLLIKAIENSREKAQLLTSSLNVKLKEIINIDYSWEEMNVYSRNYEMVETCGMCDDSRDFDANPEDISLEDSVTVIWNIE